MKMLCIILVLLIVVIVIESFIINKLIKLYKSVLKYSNYLEELCQFKDFDNSEVLRMSVQCKNCVHLELVNKENNQYCCGATRNKWLTNIKKQRMCQYFIRKHFRN
ncbi:hypothetical protein [Clostridium perfringens]|uniref:hypothetical protein n=1 Tax=Clostridium perfringens TaxID=1502 RepID=UPI0039EAD8C4